MTSVTGTLLGAWNSLVYDDLNQLTAVTRPGGYDTYEYNALGHRLRSTIAGYTTRYVYAGDRVVEDNSVTGTVLAWHTVSGSSYGDHWLHMKRWNTAHLYPAYDGTGSAREMVDGSGNPADTYTLDAFGVQLASTGSDPNPYRYGAAWGYLRESSGLYQLGYRFYWPEIGRFIQQDPIGDGMNWYAYVGNNPVTDVDPTGLRDASVAPCPDDAWSRRKAAAAYFLREAWLYHVAAFQGLCAFDDGFFPAGLGSVFHLYDPNDPNLAYSRDMGEITRNEMLVVAGYGAAAELGIEVNVLSKGNVWKIISRRLRAGFRIDPAHHGKPWGHLHFWRWRR